VNPIGSRYAQPPLHEAVQHNLDTVELLVEHGANVTKRDHRERTPLHLVAAVAGKIDVVEFLVERWPEGMKEKDHSLSTLLHYAHAAVVGLLVEGWPEAVREKNRLGHTPLQSAVGRGETEVVRLLVETWPEGLRERDIDGNTLLHLAAETLKTDGRGFWWNVGRRARRHLTTMGRHRCRRLRRHV
jgi:serine/threonine-protein phosphatase 6 regulatory ankyrin repeat subunit A